MIKHVGFLAMLVSVGFSQAACMAEPNDDSTGNDEVTSEAADALSGDNLTLANACVTKINSLRATKGLAANKNIVGIATTQPTYSGATYGDCAWKEASYDSVNGAHAAHTANLYRCLGTQNECLNWAPSAGQTATQLVQGCVQAWFNEGPGGGHYTNMTSTNYVNTTCAVYKNAAGKYSITADFKIGY